MVKTVYFRETWRAESTAKLGQYTTQEAQLHSTHAWRAILKGVVMRGW